MHLFGILSILPIPFLLPISVADLASFKIPNIYLKILFSLTLFSSVIFGMGKLLPNLLNLALLVLLSFVGIGMGDIKLLALLSWHLNILGFTQSYEVILLSLFWALCHMSLRTFIEFKAPLKIPLAPSILMAYGSFLATG